METLDSLINNIRHNNIGNPKNNTGATTFNSLTGNKSTLSTGASNSVAKSSQPNLSQEVVSSQQSSVHVDFGLFVAFMVALSAFGSFTNDMFQPAMPQMRLFFHTSISTIQLGLTMGMLGLAVGQFIMGPVSDKYGRKPILIYSLILFIISAVICVFAKSVTLFLVCRLFQGMGGSGGYFLARTMPADVYHGRSLAKAMAVIGAINGFAPASAPALGGFIADQWHWQAVFIALTVIAVILLFISPKLKETLPAERRSTGSLLKTFSQYTSLFHNHAFMTHVVFKGAALGLLFAFVSAAPFIFEDKFGLSATVFGLMMGGNSLLVAAGSMTALRFKPLKRAAKIGGYNVLLFVLAIGVVLFVHPSFWVLELLILGMLFNMGMVFTVTNTLAMNEGRESAGAASAVLGIVGYVFGAIAAPLVGLGNIFHSTAIVLAVIATIIAVSAYFSSKLAPDLNN